MHIPVANQRKSRRREAYSPQAGQAGTKEDVFDCVELTFQIVVFVLRKENNNLNIEYSAKNYINF
ncbi:MAG: hypothetical protein LBR10_12310 [Prevotellaceae bacterium]|jgi:hypothetical protein|nr:hypothetical protein [Prevotellaceae bacterium]